MSSPPQPPTVLLVEDSDDDAFFFRHALKKTGVATTLLHVGDGGAAIAHFKRAAATPADTECRWPDVVFLDLKLPTYSGFEVLEWIREQKLNHGLDVAILSGSEHKSDVDRAMALGASAYYVKPLPTEQLRAHLLQSLEKRKPDASAAPQAQRATV